MNAFEAWSLRLLQEFFPAGSEGKEVFIGTSPEVLDRIGPDLGGDAGFLDAVRQGPGWRRLPEDFVGRINELKDRRTNSRKHIFGYTDPSKYDRSFLHPPISMAKSAPTYLPYLAMFPRTAAIAAHGGFYAQLRKDLNLPEGWGSAQMKQIEGVWSDLQTWTKATSGHYGRFVVRRLGRLPYIGLAKSQVIISARDISALHDLFERQRLVPGCEITDETVVTLLNSAKEGGPGLSAGLRQAASDDDYIDELKELLVSIYKDWDGATYTSRTVARKEPAETLKGRLGLTLGDGNSLPWRVQIAIQDDQEQSPTFDSDRRWSFSYRLGLGLVATLDPKQSQEFLNGSSWTFQVGEHEIKVPRRSLWVLTAEQQIGRSAELWEDELPLLGGAYLLASETSGEALQAYLTSANPSYQEVTQVDGLPTGWRMVFLDKCQDLHGPQRALPDGLRRQKRLIALEGGALVPQEEGCAYFQYDLPRVVIIASPQFSITCSGLALIPLDDDVSHSSLDGINLVPSVRRFELPPDVEVGGEFVLSVVDESGRSLEKRTIRIVDRRAKSRAEAASYSTGLDNFGCIAPEGGLRGGLSRQLVYANGGEPPEPRLPVFAQDLGSTLDPDVMAANPAAKFLDRLSESGSLTYGRAKSLLHRLLPCGSGQAKFWHLITDLWIRGHLEIEAAPDGRIHKIHAVEPGAYSLPATAGTSRILGVLGTLTLIQWRKLTRHEHLWEPISAAVVDKARAGRSYLPVVRIVTTQSDGVLRPSLEGIGIRQLPAQGLAMAKWSATEAQVRNEITRSAHMEPPSANPRGLRKFDPIAGEFLPCGDGIQKPLGVTQELILYEYEDPHVTGWRNHAVACKGGFVQTAELPWVKWIVRGGSGLGLRQLSGSYVEARRQLWLPSSLRLPIVLERALVLCNGGPPGEYHMQVQDEGESVSLKTANAGVGLDVPANSYASLANGPWLRYDWVPLSVIQAIRGKGK